MAGPPKSAARPAAGREHGVVVRHLADWLPAIAKASRVDLVGVFDAALREARMMLEPGTAPAGGEGGARSLGSAVRRRLAVLDAVLAKAGKPPDPSTAAVVRATLGDLRAASGST